MYSMKRTSALVSPRELDEVHEFVFVDAANDHRVELQSAKERSSGRDTVEDAIELVESRQLSKAIGAQRVEADRQPMKPGVAQGRGLRGEEHAVCRHGEVANRRARRELLYQLGEIAPQQRFASRQADLVHAE